MAEQEWVSLGDPQEEAERKGNAEENARGKQTQVTDKVQGRACVRGFESTVWIVCKNDPTEKGSGESMPLVSINIMHELAYASVQLVRSNIKGDSSRVASSSSYSWRLRRKRLWLQQDWLDVRIQSPEWEQEGDHLEILYGPDYRDWYDYLVFKGGRHQFCFGLLPDSDEVGLSISR